MGVTDRWQALVAGQLGHPRGLLGRVTARALNKGNLALVTSAVEATGLRPGEVAADVGFGGGVGLPLLLDAVAPGGHVHAFDISRTMVAAARRQYADQVAAGRLTVGPGELGALPLAGGVLDAVITANTVYFVDDLAAALADLARVLRPGGRLVVAIADPDAMARMPVTAHGFRLRPVAELLGLLEGAGFTAVEDRVLRQSGPTRHLLIGVRAPTP